MGDDLISRQAAIDALEKKKDKKNQGDIGGFYNKIIQNDIDTLMLLPSADRPQGEWIEMYRNGFGNMICMCSKCNFHATKSNFCPNCGARMKGTDDE